jgi:hypothetical protein
VLHTLPGVGSPDLEATFAQEASPSGASDEVMIRIGLKVPTRIDDAVLNFLVPVDIEFWNSDFEGKPSDKGRLMLPTDEPLNPGIEFSNYWADNVELRFGSGLMNFVLRVTQPGSFKVRLRVGSEKLYESEYVADFEVTVRCGASADRRLLLPLALPLGTSEAPPSGLRQRKARACGPFLWSG